MLSCVTNLGRRRGVNHLTLQHFSGLYIALLLRGASRREADNDFEAIVDKPLHGGQDTDHRDTEQQALPQPFAAYVSGDAHKTPHFTAAFLIHLGNQGVCRVRDDGA